MPGVLCTETVTLNIEVKVSDLIELIFTLRKEKEDAENVRRTS